MEKKERKKKKMNHKETYLIAPENKRDNSQRRKEKEMERERERGRERERPVKREPNIII